MYEISKVAKFEVQHNHTIKTPDLDSRGRVTKNFKNELSGPEISFIESEAKRNTTPRDIINELELKYGYSYNLKLIRNLKHNMRKEFYGSDGDSYQRLLEWQGKYVQKDDGIFHIETEANVFTQCVYVRFPGAKPFYDQYSDFIICDGTHKTNKYNMTLVVLTLVDALGKSVLAGLMIVPSEKQEYIEKGLKKLQLDTKGSVFLTDGAACFPGLTEAMEMIHQLCAWHFSKGKF